MVDMNFLTIIAVVVFISAVKGQCISDVANISIKSCDGSQRIGGTVYIDFYQISQPCTCTVIPSFQGPLILVLWKTTGTCKTRIKVKDRVFSCPGEYSSMVANLSIGENLSVNAAHDSSSDGTFKQCMLIHEENKEGGSKRNISVSCGHSAKNTTDGSTTTKIISSELSSYPTKDFGDTSLKTTVIPTEYKSGVLNESSMVLDSTEENIYIIVGSAAGGGLVLLAIIIILIVKFSRNQNKSNHPSVHKNDAFECDQTLPDNPLYHSNQPVYDIGYSTAEEEQPRLPPSQITANGPRVYDTPVKYKSKNDVQGVLPDIPYYATPQKNKTTSTEITPGVVYAQVNKPQKNRILTQTHVRNLNQDGLVYMDVEHSQTSSAQNWPYSNDFGPEKVVYAAVKKNKD